MTSSKKPTQNELTAQLTEAVKDVAFEISMLTQELQKISEIYETDFINKWNQQKKK